VSGGRRLLVRGGRVLTLDPALGDLDPGDVLVEGERIAAVGPRVEVGSGPCEVLDARGAIVLPGFVDAHRHVWQTQLRGVAADWTLFDYFVRMRLGYGAFYGPEDAYLGNLCGALEALDAGVTTLVDHCHVLHSPEHADEALRGLDESGIRGVFCYGLFPSPTHHPFRWAPGAGWRADDARRLRREKLAGDGGLVRFGLAPGEVEATPFDVTCEEIRLGRELGAARISCHVAMGRWDRGGRLVRRLGETGLLGPDLLLVHGSALTDEELGLAADAGASVCATPETELQMGMGHPVVERARAAGVATGLGVDIVSNYSGDLFAQMRLQLQAERGAEHAREHAAGAGPPRALRLRAREALELATLGGARAAGVDAVAGSLTPGKHADLVLVRTDAIHMAPASDPVAAAVLYARPSDVDTVLVAGQVRKRAGRLAGVDWPALAARLAASAERIHAGFRTLDVAALERLVAGAML
jgi:cytosine/adenosine deaminase-related metal-dependent hydrolase